MKNEAVFLAILAFSIPTMAQAQVITALSGEALNMTIGGLIDKINHDLNNTITNGVNQTNGAVVNAASQANIVLANLQIEYQNSLNETVSQLNEQQQQIFVKAQNMVQDANALEGKAYSLETTTDLDVTQIESQFPFSHVPEFYFKRVEGTSLLKGNTNYSLKIIAYGIANSSDSKVSFSAQLSGTSISFAQDPSIPSEGEVDFVIPSSVFAPLFDPVKLVPAKLVVTVSITKSKYFGLWHSTNSYQIPIWLNLYPNQAATGVLTSAEPTYSWVDIGTVSGGVETSPAAPNKCRYTQCDQGNIVNLTVHGSGSAIPELGDQRIVNLSLECVSHDSQCAFTPAGDIHATINASGISGSISFITDSISQLFRANGDVQQFEETGSKTTDIPVTFEFNSLTKTPVDNAATLVTLHVTPFFNPLGYDLPVPGSDPNGLITFVSRTPNVLGPGIDALVFQTNPPP